MLPQSARAHLLPKKTTKRLHLLRPLLLESQLLVVKELLVSLQLMKATYLFLPLASNQ